METCIGSVKSGNGMDLEGQEMDKESILNDAWIKFRLSIGLDPNEEMSPKAVEYFCSAMEEYSDIKHTKP